MFMRALITRMWEKAMLYQINQKNYSTFKVFRDNKLPPRGYFIPFSSVKKAADAKLINRRYVSDRVVCLNGEWDFAYFPKFSDMPKKFDTDKIVFDKLEVPSCWQFKGYEPPFYTNVKFPFPVVPPRIPTRKAAGKYGEDINGEKYVCGKKQYNSVGVYRTFFNVTDLGKTRILSLLGVASCAEVYINGKYVGYSEGAHNTAEFDIGKYLISDSNELLIVVHKWCNGSYLEDQDMFRNNGIFRDVLMFENENSYVWDFDFFTAKRGAIYDCFIKAVVKEPEEVTFTAELSDNGKVIAVKSVAAKSETNVAFEKLDVTEWNAEEPKLYTLTLTLRKNGEIIECIKKLVGFRTVEISGRTFLFNGRKIKLKGVNHHDTNPYEGYCMTADQLAYDIMLFKAFNVNTVRTSHYPPDPLFIELCDFYGIYVVDEADIESHGTTTDLQISNKLKWKNHFWDRVSAMYYRDRNSCSITMWSLGNESGGIKCQDYCYARLKEISPLPVHYERACAFKRTGYDVISNMYPSVDRLRMLLENTALVIPGQRKIYAQKPYFMCEYAHAMGVSPGSLEDYWDVIYSHDNAMGGCIWEFADHTIYHGAGAKYHYTYGGDHGEYTHDGNFCADGLFFSDRRPHTAAYAMKNAYRPLRARLLSPNGLIEFTNLNSFSNANYITIKGGVFADGEKTGSFEFSMDIAPNCKETANLHLIEQDKDVTVHLDYFEGKHLVATEELRLKEKLIPVKVAEGGTFRYTDDNNGILCVTFNGGKVKFDTEAGVLTSYVFEDKEFTAAKPVKSDNKGSLYTNIYRAYIDNDRNIVKKWHEAGYDSLTFTPDGCAYRVGENHIKISARHLMKNAKGKTLFLSEDTYTVYSNGVIDLQTRLTPKCKGLPMLPRVGKILELNKEFDNVIYYGCGGFESYPDLKGQSRLGVFSAKVAEMNMPYVRPQFCGSHTDCRYAVMRNGEGRGLLLLADSVPFNFSVKRTTDSTLEKCKHQEDVPDDGVNYVSIDGFMGGIGSNSCGPLPMDNYVLRADKAYAQSFRIIPFAAITDGDIILFDSAEK